MNDTYQNLLNTAENSIRSKGYNAVSFRELADDLGIKSSSVHYYFKQKELMGLALVERYSTNFFTHLVENTAEEMESNEKIDVFCNLYRQSLVDSETLCLCGMLGAEVISLPQPLSDAVGKFFLDNIDWLVTIMDEKLDVEERSRHAKQLLASLQGAMMLSVSLGDKEFFDQSVASWKDSYNAVVQSRAS